MFRTHPSAIFFRNILVFLLFCIFTFAKLYFSKKLTFVKKMFVVGFQYLNILIIGLCTTNQSNQVDQGEYG